ncbi:response regulator transcription factor [Enterococcus dongliensis]|uniref:response regulator transcription factor n=1 Tax=Enterococcus dongliensis TaxID=2559925 RepID=UPI00288DA156|nr:response regulator transcription factor [Enterococcus dongliensis]MDT2674203.1 response regulator transcription factor [Enterococcus dongliensis]
MSQILIVEDDTAVHVLLKEVLTTHGFITIDAYSGTEGRLLLDSHEVDLILLDLMLPGLSGEDFVNEIRQKSQVPIIVLTAKGDQIDKNTLLAAGVDDYMVKPFDINELLLRIAIQLRHQSVHSPAKSESVLHYKEIFLELETRIVTVSGNEIHLTGREFSLLELFLTHPQKVFSRANLYESAWEDPYFESDKSVNMHISNLRKKLSSAGVNYIQTIWGVGFKFD